MSKVVLAGTPFYGYIDAIAEAIKKNNKEVKVVKHYNDGQLLMILAQKINSRAFIEYQRKTFRSTILNACNKGDRVILFRADILNPEDIDTIRNKCASVVAFWLIDSFKTMRQGLELCLKSDITFCYNSGEAQYLNGIKKQAYFLPLAYDAAKYYAIKNKEKDIDLYFVGSLHINRKILLNELLKRLEPFKYKIIIDGSVCHRLLLYQKRQQYKQYPYLMKYVTSRFPSHFEINQMSNRAKLCLNILPTQATSALNIRAYEICGSGAFQLINRNKILNYIFNEGTEVVSYSDVDELVNLIKYYIKAENTLARQDIANRGHQKALREHTFDIRVQQIMHNLSLT